MTTFKIAILALAAIASTEAVWFANSAGKIWGVPSEGCVNFPDWINDKAVKYEVENPYACKVYEHFNCAGNSRQVGATNWKKVPFTGISSVNCFKA